MREQYEAAVDRNEVMRVLGISQATYYRGVRDGSIPSFLVGRRRRHFLSQVLDAVGATAGPEKSPVTGDL